MADRGRIHDLAGEGHAQPISSQRLLELYDRVADAPDAVEQLRKFVLDLAVRGKLVEQDEGDEPADALLERIEAEKARLHRVGQIKKPKKLPKVEEYPYPLPTNWRWTRIRQVTSDRGQKVPDQRFTYIDVSAIDKKAGVVSEPKILDPDDAPSRARKITSRGDLIYSCVRPYLLNIAVIDHEFDPEPIVSTAFAVLNGHGLVLPWYLWIVLRSPFMIENVEAKQRGQAYPAINDKDFSILLFPLAPLEEQQRIVAGVNQLMVLLDRMEATRTQRETTRNHLTTASLTRLTASETTDADFPAHARFALDNLDQLTSRPEQIKVLRQTILNLAVRGKLVEQDPGDEPASELLNRINLDSGVQQRWHKRKPKQLPTVDLSHAPYELPDGWTWARFPELGTFGRGKSKHRPRNDPALYTGGTHLMIQTGDVARSGGRISTYTNKYNKVGLAQSMLWPKGTLCITIAANIADSGILEFDACFPDSVVGFIPNPVFQSSRYLEYFVRTAKAHLLEFAPATAQKNINLEVLKSVLIPLPPLAEQQRIVAKVNAVMSLCDCLEAALSTTGTTRAELFEALLREVVAPPTEQKLAAVG